MEPLFVYETAAIFFAVLGIVTLCVLSDAAQPRFAIAAELVSVVTALAWTVAIALPFGFAPYFFASVRGEMMLGTLPVALLASPFLFSGFLSAFLEFKQD